MMTIPPDSRPDYYTVMDIAHLLSVSKTTVYNMLKRGDLTRIRFGSIRRVTAASYEAYRHRAEQNDRETSETGRSGDGRKA